MSLHINITADTPIELKHQLESLVALFDPNVMEQLPGHTTLAAVMNTYADTPTTPAVNEKVEPVITQERMEENIANAPVHEEPPMPTLEEVRAALKKLRDKKGAAVVKEILKEYGADSLPELKEEDYLIVRDRALAEV